MAGLLTALGAEPAAHPSQAVSPAAALPEVSPAASPDPPAVRRSRRQREHVSYADAGAEIDDDED